MVGGGAGLVAELLLDDGAVIIGAGSLRVEFHGSIQIVQRFGEPFQVHVLIERRLHGFTPRSPSHASVTGLA